MGDLAGLQLGTKQTQGCTRGREPGRARGGYSAGTGRPWGSGEPLRPPGRQGTHPVSPPFPSPFPRCSLLQKMFNFLLSQSRLWRDPEAKLFLGLWGPHYKTRQTNCRNRVLLRGSQSERSGGAKREAGGRWLTAQPRPCRWAPTAGPPGLLLTTHGDGAWCQCHPAVCPCWSSLFSCPATLCAASVLPCSVSARPTVQCSGVTS